MSCRHKKPDGGLGLKLKYCYACGAKRAGEKPKPKFKVGWWAIADHLDGPGTITRVKIELLGLGIEEQRWYEEVTIVTDGGDMWQGPASSVTRLVAAPSED